MPGRDSGNALEMCSFFAGGKAVRVQPTAVLQVWERAIVPVCVCTYVFAAALWRLMVWKSVYHD